MSESCPHGGTCITAAICEARTKREAVPPPESSSGLPFDRAEHAECLSSIRTARRLQAMAEKKLAEVTAERDDLMKYIDAAKLEAQKRGRVSGEPLADWISRLPEDART